ncbi:MAG: undecaprenyl-diphosphate phosphatase [Phycisphaerales bacterium]
MELWQAVVLGLVEGITEYLPVSSTGHLILASHLMGLDTPEAKDAVDAFNIVVQGGAILAVAGLYWPRCRQMLRGAAGRDADGRRLLLNLFIAFLPAAITGLLLKKLIETYLFGPGPVLAAVLAGGLFMFAVEGWKAGRFGLFDAARRDAGIEAITMRQALVIGLLQCVAMWPGMSRSMMTIAGGMFLGLSRRSAAEFGFLLGLPTLGAATCYSLYRNLSDAGEGGNLFQKLGTGPVLVGLVVATVSAAAAIKWLVGYLSRHGLAAFGWYRLALFFVMLLVLWS